MSRILTIKGLSLVKVRSNRRVVESEVKGSEQREALEFGSVNAPKF